MKSCAFRLCQTVLPDGFSNLAAMWAGGKVDTAAWVAFDPLCRNAKFQTQPHKAARNKGHADKSKIIKVYHPTTICISPWEVHIG